MTPAYTYGWWAAAVGAPAQFNPFRPGTVSHDDWADGHADFVVTLGPVDRKLEPEVAQVMGRVG